MQDGAYNGNNRKPRTSPVTAGLVGAAAGAAIGIGLAAVLADPQKRKKVEKKFQDIQKWGNKTLSELKDKSMEAQDQLTDEVLPTAAEKVEKMQKELDEAAMQAQQKVK
jgi:Flp pilus assembly protein TadB